MWFLVLLFLTVPATAQYEGFAGGLAQGFANGQMVYMQQQAIQQNNPYLYQQLRQEQLMEQQRRMIEQNNRILKEQEFRRQLYGH